MYFIHLQPNHDGEEEERRGYCYGMGSHIGFQAYFALLWYTSILFLLHVYVGTSTLSLYY